MTKADLVEKVTGCGFSDPARMYSPADPPARRLHRNETSGDGAGPRER